jgi:hypothetical protein
MEYVFGGEVWKDLGHYYFVGEEGYGRDVGRGLERKILIFAL